MSEERLTKSAWKTEEGCRRRKRLTLKRRDSDKIDLEWADVNSAEWERMTEDRDGWRRLVERAEQIK